MRLKLASSILLCTGMLASPLLAAPVKVEIQKNGADYTLVRHGENYPVKGAGGDADKPLLAKSGGNSFRTWGAGDDAQAKLDEAQANGLTVAVGIWLGHHRHGFDYGDPAQVQKQFEDAKAAVLRYKDHPALLVWGVGNEMEEYAATTDPRVWKAVNDIARMIKQVDPNHPTMTVIAEIGGDKLPSIMKYCPDVDIVGINSYGGVTSIPERYKQSGIKKPYIVTEFGPPGTWEIGKNEWDVPLELTSTQKADIYKNAYLKLDNDPQCLGSYAFTWGFKQEATATWFGMFMPDGTKTAAVDAMTEVWSGKPPANLCPRIEIMSVVGESIVEAGTKVRVQIQVSDPEGVTPKVEWVLFEEMKEFESMGDFRPTPPTFPQAITEANHEGVTVVMPDRAGNYRLVAFVHDGAGGGAVANVPLRIDGKVDTQRGQHVNLPLVVFGDNMKGSPYIPSGYMGDHDAIKMNEKSNVKPQSGATCIEVSFNNPGGWGGVVWQSPANDWGDKPGGYDLSNAGTLSFWVRGDKGGEKVKFGFGLIGRDKPYHDTGKADKEVTLSTEWQQIKIPLSGKNLKCIKSGFFWTVPGNGAAQKFYLDDIVYTDEKGTGAEGGEAAAAAAAQLPFQLMGDGLNQLPYIPSGYMGDTDAIKMTDGVANNPHSGATCTQVTFANAGGWGGVVWQSPVNDWGDQPGGFDLSGAKTVTVWARGEKGGETVKFGMGILKDVAYPDSGSAEKEFTLTSDWAAYTLDLTGKDLTRIKTGFYWVVAGQGEPVNFYLDDISYTGSDTPQ